MGLSSVESSAASSTASLTATGPGAASRFQIGLVITTGLGIGTVFTLFVVPAYYLLIARDHRQTAPEPAAAVAKPSGEVAG